MEGWIDGRRGVCVHYIQINGRMDGWMEEGWKDGCVCTLYTDEWKDGWMDGRMDVCVYIIYRWMVEWNDVCVHYIQINGRMDGWMEEGWMDRRMDVCTLYTDEWKDG